MTTTAPKHQTPPALNYEPTTMTVGTLTKSFESGDGPQRDRPQDKKYYIRSLRARSKAYGDYNPAILRPRVVSDRGNGKFWVLDGNGSNHWLEVLFGPDFPVPVYLMTGLTLAQENTIFQQIQRGKHVTRNEQFANDLEFNDASAAYKITKVLQAEGFHTTNQVKNPWGLGATTSEYIYKRYGLSILKTVLDYVKQFFSDDDWKRTNGALVKALAIMIGNEDYDNEVLANALLGVTDADELAHDARGSGGESIVLPRIMKLYHDTAKAKAAKAAVDAGVQPQDVSDQLLHGDAMPDIKDAADNLSGEPTAA
jgi:hypothetical protein